MAKKCSGINCPFMRVVSDDCNFVDCPYRTEAIDPQEVISGLCNYIADLVVQKLKTEKEKSITIDQVHNCYDCKHSSVSPYEGPCRLCSINVSNIKKYTDNFEPKEEADEVSD